MFAGVVLLLVVLNTASTVNTVDVSAWPSLGSSSLSRELVYLLSDGVFPPQQQQQRSLNHLVLSSSPDVT